MTTATHDLTEDTAYLITDAGLDALRTAELPDAEPGAATPEGFWPTTETEIDWVLRKVNDARARAARIRENMEAMAREAEAEAKFFEWKYGAALMDFCRKQTEGGRRKSHRLPNGVLGFRTKPAAVKVGDEGKALAWARENLPGAVTLRLDVKALSAALTVTEAGSCVFAETGEALEFAAGTPAEEVFYVK